MKHMTKEEQLKLFLEAKKGDKKALDLLITSNIPLYQTIAKRLGYKHKGGTNIEDLVQEGLIGVIYNSFRKFDPEGGSSWSTYSARGAKMAMLNAITKNKGVSGLSSNALNRSILFLHLQDPLQKTGAIRKKIKEKYKKCSRERIQRHRAALCAISLEALEESGVETPLSEQVSDESLRDLFLVEAVQRRLSKLKFTPKMKYVIDNLMSSERKSQVDIAAEWGCSRQNVAMLEAKAKTLLRPLLADLV